MTCGQLDDFRNAWNVSELGVVAMLAVLRDQLTPVIDEISFAELVADDQHALGRALRQVADVPESTRPFPHRLK